MQNDQAAIHIRVLWGLFDAKGNWTHNPILPMAAEDQFRQNVLTDPERMRRYTQAQK